MYHCILHRNSTSKSTSKHFMNKNIGDPFHRKLDKFLKIIINITISTLRNVTNNAAGS